MRLSEAINSFNLDFNPLDANERYYFTHLDIEVAKEIRKAGQKAKRELKKQNFTLFS